MIKEMDVDKVTKLFKDEFRTIFSNAKNGYEKINELMKKSY